MHDTFTALLTTKGRKTGRAHRVMLRAVRYNGRIYLSRHRPDGDWFRNAMAEPKVGIKYDDKSFEGHAKLVTDEGLERRISEMKYPGQARAEERRVVVEVTLESPSQGQSPIPGIGTENDSQHN